MTEQQTQATDPTSQSQTKTQRTRTKSEYLFPTYDFNMGKLIAETVERDGGGALTEETLAIDLGLSAKSSGFQLKALTARQFGLLTKQGETLTTTQLAKSIFKPANDDERRKALAESFMKIPLFQAVVNRFKGQPIPQSENFRNILEREFKIDTKRVGDAERVLMDSARDTGVLGTSGNNKYLSVEKAITSNQQPADYVQPKIEAQTGIMNPIPPLGRPRTIAPQITEEPQVGMLPGISEDDLLLLERNNPTAFKAFWDSFGQLILARAKQKQAKPEKTNKTEEEPEDIPFS